MNDIIFLRECPQCFALVLDKDKHALNAHPVISKEQWKMIPFLQPPDIPDYDPPGNDDDAADVRNNPSVGDLELAKKRIKDSDDAAYKSNQLSGNEV